MEDNYNVGPALAVVDAGTLGVRPHELRVLAAAAHAFLVPLTLRRAQAGPPERDGGRNVQGAWRSDAARVGQTGPNGSPLSAQSLDSWRSVEAQAGPAALDAGKEPLDSTHLLYACEGLAPIGEAYARGGAGLSDLFALLRGYIRCLAAARDLLLNTAHIGSDPQASVFVDLAQPGAAAHRASRGAGGEVPHTSSWGKGMEAAPPPAESLGGSAAAAAHTAGVRCIYGPDEYVEIWEKACRVASAFAAHGGIMGARECMEQFCARRRSRSPGPAGILKTLDYVQREWNYILAKA